MIKFFILFFLYGFNTFAQDASVGQYYSLLNTQNRAKADAGRIAKIILIESEPVLIKKNSNVSTSKQALLSSDSCQAILTIESLNYDEKSNKCPTDKKNDPKLLRNANIAIEMNFETSPKENTKLKVQLFAQDPIRFSDLLKIVDDDLNLTSDDLGHGANTVVYIVDAQYAFNYLIFGVVYIQDEMGTNCAVATNMTIIQ